MDETAGERLSEFSRAVRRSTLKRLGLVPSGEENWRVDESAMSFADIARHLIDADCWLFEKLENPDLESMTGGAGLVEIRDREQYLQLLVELEQTGQRRAELIAGLAEEKWNRKIHDGRFGGEVTVWWIIARGNLDHEIHHRGQISAYLRMLGKERL